MTGGHERMKSSQKDWKNRPLGRDPAESEVLGLVEF